MVSCISFGYYFNVDGVCMFDFVGGWLWAIFLIVSFDGLGLGFDP